MRVLVVRVGRLGDLVMITPALDALIARFPDAQLTLLTSPEGRRVLAGFDPRLAEIWVHRRGSLWPFRERSELRRRILAAGFERIYLFESHPSYAQMVRGADAEVVTLAPHDPRAPVMHYAERCARAVDAEVVATPVRLPVGAEGRASAAALLESAGIDAGTFLVGLHPSFAERARLFGDGRVRRHKSWPAAKWAELASRLSHLARARGVEARVVMDLLAEDRALGEEIVGRSQGAATLLTPPPDFERYKATIASMNLFVAPDTGPMHLAAAVGAPVVALFSGKDPEDCGPYAPPGRCAVLRAEESPEGTRRGLAAIEVERVVEACELFLPSSGGVVRGPDALLG